MYLCGYRCCLAKIYRSIILLAENNEIQYSKNAIIASVFHWGTTFILPEDSRDIYAVPEARLVRDIGYGTVRSEEQMRKVFYPVRYYILIYGDSHSLLEPHFHAPP